MRLTHRADIHFSRRFTGPPPWSTDGALPEAFTLPFLLDGFFDDDAALGNDFGRQGPPEPVFRLRQEADRAKLRAQIGLLSDAAVERREWTIPENAVVDNRTDQFAYVVLQEAENYVSFLFRDGIHYFLFAFDRITRTWLNSNLRIQNARDKPPDKGVDEDHRLTVTYVCSLLLYDFWVTEYLERRKTLNPTRVQLHKTTLPWAARGPDGRVLIYRPHIRYLEPPTGASVDERGSFRRFLTFRSAHVRNLNGHGNASVPALLLAGQYGLTVPEGYTFVRPFVHGDDTPERRSHIERRREYRSRSALRALCNVQFFHENHCAVQWEQFEKDVKEFLVTNGFQIIFPSWTRRGDGGIDIVATTTESGEQRIYCVQCKCWSANRVVGLGVLRDFESRSDASRNSWTSPRRTSAG